MSFSFTQRIFNEILIFLEDSGNLEYRLCSGYDKNQQKTYEQVVIFLVTHVFTVVYDTHQRHRISLFMYVASFKKIEIGEHLSDIYLPSLN